MNYYLDVLKNYATFTGRARRSEYWYFQLFNVIISMVLGFVDASIFGVGPEDVGMIGLVYSLGVIVPSIAVAVRRMHDVGKSGWYCLIPIYNFILACTDGEQRTNEYGPDPKGRGEDDITDHLVG